MEIMETLEVKKLPIMPTLRSLEVGDECEFPVEQRSSVNVLLNRMRTDNMRIGWDAKLETDTEAFTVKVTRLK
jgi:hypothetical protein